MDDLFPERKAPLKALRAWAANNARRDEVIRAAAQAGVPQQDIHQITGLARSTILRVTGPGVQRAGNQARHAAWEAEQRERERVRAEAQQRRQERIAAARERTIAMRRLGRDVELASDEQAAAIRQILGLS